jgi:hypothetical protein
MMESRFFSGIREVSFGWSFLHIWMICTSKYTFFFFINIKALLHPAIQCPFLHVAPQSFFAGLSPAKSTNITAKDKRASFNGNPLVYGGRSNTWPGVKIIP